MTDGLEASGSAVKGMLRFKGNYDVWNACNVEGKRMYELKPGDRVAADLNEEGLPVDALLREALEAGIAEVIEA